MSSTLAQQTCKPCQGDEAPMKGPELQSMLEQLQHGWSVVDEHHLQKSYDFSNFKEALDFANRVGEVAEEQGHHPDIGITWGRTDLKVWTHKIDGLTESDFIFAAKADEVR